MRPTPYRLLVSAIGFRHGRTYKGRGPHHKGAYSAITPTTYGYVGWTDDQPAEPWRLAGSGTFCFPGLHTARSAAFAYLALPATTGVSVRTNQDRPLYRFIKQPDGRVTGYSCSRED